jgi:DNA-binding transcriptional MerR regulator
MTRIKPVIADDKWLTIGEAAGLTGVNPVTLRAWQRRFGLVVPKRTPKGHRLYSQAHLTQIEEILYWLNKGVSISKVKPLLKVSAVKAAVKPLAENTSLSAVEVSFWQENILFLNQCCINLDATALHKKLNELTALYPFTVLKSCLYWPWLSGHEATMGERIDAATIQAWLSFELAAQFSARRLALLQEDSEPAALLVSIGKEPHWSPLIFSAELSANNVKHQQININSVNELGFIAHRIPSSRILLIAHPQFNNADTRELELLMQSSQGDINHDGINLIGIYAKSVNQHLGLSHLSIKGILDSELAIMTQNTETVLSGGKDDQYDC